MDRYEQAGSRGATSGEEFNEDDSVFGLPVEFHLDDKIVAESAQYWAPHYMHKDGTLSPELIRIISQLNAEQVRSESTDATKDTSATPRSPARKRRQSSKSSAAGSANCGARGLRRSNRGDQQEMNEEQKTELVEQLVQLIKEQTKELEENKNSCVSTGTAAAVVNDRLVSSRPKPSQYCIVPVGWQRKTIGPSNVVYISPSGEVLDSLPSVNEYLTNAGTCKCGIDCPIRVDQVFNFDPCVMNAAAPGVRPLSNSCSCLVANRTLPSMPLIGMTKRSRGRPKKSERAEQSTSFQQQQTSSNHQTKLERSITDILRQSSICPKSSKKRSSDSTKQCISPIKIQAGLPNKLLDEGKSAEQEAIRHLFTLCGNGVRRQDGDVPGMVVPNDSTKGKNYLDEEFIPSAKMLEDGKDIREFAKHLIFTNPCDNKNSFNFDFMKTKSKSRKSGKKSGERSRTNTARPSCPPAKKEPEVSAAVRVEPPPTPVTGVGPDDDSSRQSLNENSHVADNLFELFNDLSESMPLFDDSNSLFGHHTSVSPLEENWPGCRL